jgi:hypothetical protein
MKHRADIKQFGIEPKAFALAGERAEQIDARRMVEQQVWFGVADELREIARHLAVRDLDPGNIVHVPLGM